MTSTSSPVRIQLEFAADRAGSAKAVEQLTSQLSGSLQTALAKNQTLVATLQKLGAGSAIGSGPNGLAAQTAALQLRIGALTGNGGAQLNRFFGAIQTGSRQSYSALNRMGDSMVRLAGTFYSLERLGGILNRVLVSPIVDFTKAMIKADESSRKFEYSVASISAGLSKARMLNKAIIDISRNSPQSVESIRESAQTLARTPALAARLGLGDAAAAASESERFGSVIGRLGTLDPSQGQKGAMISVINALQGGPGALTSLKRRFGINASTLSSISGISRSDLASDPAQALKAIESFADVFIPREAHARVSNLLSVRWQKIQDAADAMLSQVADAGIFDSLGLRLKNIADEMFEHLGSDEFDEEARKVSAGLERVLGNVFRSTERLLNSITGKPNDISSVAGTVRGVGNLVERLGMLSDNLPALADKFGPAVTSLAGKIGDFVDAVIEIADAARDPYGFVERVASGARNHLTGQDPNLITLKALKRAGVDTTLIGTREYAPGTNSDHVYREMRNDGASLPRALGRFAIETIRDANGANVQKLKELDFLNLPIEQRILAQKIYSQAQETGQIDPKAYSQLGSMTVARQANSGTLPSRADEDPATSLVRKLIAREYQSPNFGALLQAARSGSGPIGELAERDQSPLERFREVSDIFGKIKIGKDDVVSFGQLLKRIDEQFIESKTVLERAIGEGDQQLLGGDDQDLRAGVAELRKQRERLIEDYRVASAAIAQDKLEAVRDFGAVLGDSIRDLPPEARVEVQRAIRDGLTSQARQFVEIFGEPQGGMKKNFGTGAMSLEELRQTYSGDLQTRVEALAAAGRHGDILTLPTNASFEQIRELKALTPTQGQSQLLSYYNGEATANARELLARAGKEFQDTPDEVSLANLRAAQTEVAELSSKILQLQQSLPGLRRDMAEMSVGIRESLESNLGQAFYDLASGVGNLKDVLRSFAQDVLKIWSDLSAKNAIAGLLGGFGQQTGGVTQTNFSGGLLDGIGTGIRNYFTGGTPSMASSMPVQASVLDVPRFAEGGIVNRATVAMAGEAGPEAFIPLKHGRVPVSIVGAPRVQGGSYVPSGSAAGGQTVVQAPAPEVKVFVFSDPDEIYRRGFNKHRDVLINTVNHAVQQGKIGRR